MRRSQTTTAGVLAAVLIVTPVTALGRGGGSSGSHTSSSHSTGAQSTHAGSGAQHRSSYAVGVPRDSHGRIKRSEVAKRNFQQSHPCPSTGKTSGACPGYVVDHVTPLKRGGADAPSNMQWQTKAAKEKDKTE